MSPGTRLGPYEIVSRIGAGGMGEVFRASDTRLQRDVAIKKLPAGFADNPRLKLRFQREAKLISQLTHPHICTLYDVGEDYLVMELLEGQSLADRLARGALPLSDVLRYGAQIAEALDRAHRAGVVHRDLKPGNIMITKLGAKLLDFGLARDQDSGLGPHTSAVATAHKPLTEEGTILGTYQYMAPEQLEGIGADARSDLWALGCVLYEMATGKRAFERNSKTSLIAAIVKENPPPLRTLQPLTPPPLEHVVEKCLSKDPDDRWQSAHDVAEELRWIASSGSQAGMAAPVTSRKRHAMVAWSAAIAVLVALGVVAAAVWSRRAERPEPMPMRFVINLAADPNLVPEAFGKLAVSPDGATIAYIVLEGETSRLYLRAIGESEAKPVAGSEGAVQPFFAPDGKWVAFFARGKLWKVPVAGGAPVFITKASYPRGGTWGDDGTIIFAPFFYSNLFRVSSQGGPARAVTHLRRGEGERNHRWPYMLPGSGAFLYTAGLGGSFDDALVMAQRIEGGEPEVVIRGGCGATYLPTGHLAYVRGNSLYAIRFDPQSLRTEGEAVRILTGVSNHTAGSADYATSRNGLLAYLQPGAAFDEVGKVTLINRAGKRLGPTFPELAGPRFSPDEKRFSVERSADEIWVYEIERGAAARLTSDVRAIKPVWTPDGRRVAFSYEEKGPWNPFWRAADGSTPLERIVSSEESMQPSAFTPDGKKMLVTVGRTYTGFDIGIVDLQTKKLDMVIESDSQERWPEFSPDGQWVVYTSDESGRFEIYVRHLDGAGRWQISNAGGDLPRWKSPSEIIYKKGGKFMSVAVSTSPAFRAATPTLLFEGPYSDYDVSKDGQRFLVVEQREGPPVKEMQVVVNWFEEVQQLLGGAKR